MGLADAIQGAVSSAFAVIDSGLVTGVITHFTSQDPSYNTATGALVDSSADHTVKMLRSKWSSSEIFESDVKSGQIKMLVPASSISFTPTERDYITIDSEKWVIKNLNKDPFGKLYTLRLEKF